MGASTQNFNSPFRKFPRSKAAPLPPPWSISKEGKEETVTTGAVRRLTLDVSDVVEAWQHDGRAKRIKKKHAHRLLITGIMHEGMVTGVSNLQSQKRFGFFVFQFSKFLAFGVLGVLY